MNASKQIVVTPVLSLTRWNLDRPDEPKTLPNGMNVGDGKFKLSGFFDPESADGAKFIEDAISFLGGSKKARDAVMFALPDNASLARPVPGIPDGWRRLTAKTKYGPVEVIDRKGNVLKNVDNTVYAGARVRAAVVLVPFDDPRLRGAKNVSFGLKTAISLGDGEPLAFGARRIDPRDVFASEIVTDIDPLSDF